jgi:hypothetical protein
MVNSMAVTVGITSADLASLINQNDQQSNDQLGITRSVILLVIGPNEQSNEQMSIQMTIK